MKPRVPTLPITKAEMLVIDAIVCRALIWFNDRTERDIKMDLIATHLVCPLRLNDLLDSDDTNFVHDIVGIERHLDRAAFKLLDCFRPRYAQPMEQPNASL